MSYRPNTTRSHRLTCCALALHFVVVLAGEAAATPESRAAVLFLLISPSSRANGMGGAGVALADETGAYYNPAAPALVARHHLFAATFYEDPVRWLLTDDLRYSYSAFQVGWNSSAWSQRFSPKHRSGGPFSVSAALCLYRTRLDLGTQVRTDERGNVQGSFESFDKADNYAFSIGVHYLLDLGLGLPMYHNVCRGKFIGHRATRIRGT
jgi:hypothetical protein